MPVRRRAILAAILTLATAVGCSGARWNPPVTAATQPDTIAWSSCATEAQKLNPKLPRGLSVECGSIQVPQDWKTAKDGKAADGKTFEIALMRIRSKDQKNRLGAIVTNPGGPGGSGIKFLPRLAGDVPGLLERFDLIGFDPRGVGRSATVKCISDADMDASFGYEPDPASDAAFQGAVTLARRVADGCGAKFGESLSLYSTEQAAHDIDAIRASLGEERLNYLGYSYGTLLGAVYAQLYPRNIRAMVLDGAVDPRQSATATSEGQAMGFERAFTNFAIWCKQNTAQCPIAPDAKTAVLDVMNRARTNPAKSPDGRVATAGWVFYAVVSTLYSEQAWPYLAQAIADLRQGSPRVAFMLADSYAERGDDGHFSNLFDANNAVNCSDADYPTVEQIRTLQAEWRAKYPLFGAPLAVGMLNCAVWPAKKDPYPVGAASGSPPIVVVGTKGDPATPYESTPKLAEMLGTGIVLTWDGEGHTAYPETRCIRAAVDEYFVDLKAPGNGLTCPAR
jgi:pimeloyl-ACP methyl ester carboxylesterase